MKARRELRDRVSGRINRLSVGWRIRFLRSMVLLNRNKLPGFRGAGAFDVIIFFVGGLMDRNFTLNAAAMAYRLFFALFPGLIFLFTLLPFVEKMSSFPMGDIEDGLLAFLGQVLPANGFTMVTDIVQEVFHDEQIGLLSANFALTLFSSISGIKAMMYAFSKVDNPVFVKRNILWVHLTALGIFLVLVAGLLLSVAIWVYGELLIQGWADDGIVVGSLLETAARVSAYLAMIVVYFFVISFIYYLGPETKERWKFFSPGSILGATLQVAAIIAFKVFLENIVNYSKFYGSISALILLMVWFYWMSIVILIGFELNAAIATAKECPRGKVNFG